MKDWAARRRFALLLLLLRARGDVTTPTSLQASVSLWVTPGCAERGKQFDFPAKLALEEGGGEDEASPKLRATLGLRLIIPDTDADSAVPA